MDKRKIRVSFSLGETAYFGWNWMPASDAELICDGISMLLLALAYLGGRHDQA